MSVENVARLALKPFLRPKQDDFIPKGDEVFHSEFGQMFDQHNGRRCNKWLHYLSIYDRVLGPRRGTTVRLLEIGVSRGGSLELWRQFLGPQATIHGVDIDPACAELNTDDLPVHIGSQADQEFMRSVATAMGGIDVVIDDGSHVANHQRASFDVLWPLLPEAGLYIIEDAHTSYWLRHGGGFRRPGTAIQMAKGMVDGMHAWYHRVPLSRRPRAAKQEVESITFYDSIIVIEKSARSRPVVDIRGG